MKKLYSLVVLLLLVFMGYGQAYVPFPTNNAQWNQMVQVYDGGPYGNSYYYNYQFSLNGDTLIDGKLYSKLFKGSSYIGGLREDTSRNIYIYPKSAQIGMWGYSFPNDTSEQLLYTFNNLEVGSTFTINSLDISVYGIDSIEFDGVFHKRYRMLGTKMWAYEEYWIEGIGSDHELLGIYCYFEEFERCYYTLCFTGESGVTYYVNTPGGEELCYYVGTHDLTLEPANIFPNPVTDYLRIKNERSGISETFITNIAGQVVQHDIFNGDVVINTKELTPGVYSITLVTGNERHVGKFVKR